MKNHNNEDKESMLIEYDFSNGTRGKYAKEYEKRILELSKSRFEDILSKREKLKNWNQIKAEVLK